MKQQYGVNPNVYIHNFDSAHVYTMRPLLGEFLNKIAPKYRNYEFLIMPSNISNTNAYELRVCKVLAGGTLIGTITESVHVGLKFENGRIATSLERKKSGYGAYRATKNVTYAQRIFADFFSVPEPAHILTERYSDISSAVYRINHKAVNHISIVERVCRGLTKHLVANWDVFAEILKDEGTCADEDIANVPSLFKTAMEYKTCADRAKAGCGVVLYEQYGNLYACNASNAGKGKIVNKDSLPDDIKTKYAMLRIAEVQSDEPVIGVGIRADDVYWIDTEEHISEE